MPAGRPKGQPRTGGRIKGTPNHATADIKALAQVHGPAALARLAEIAFGEPLAEVVAVRQLTALLKDGAAPPEIAKFARTAFAQRAEGTCVAAVRELLDRGYGKAPQPHDGDGQGGAIKWIVGWEK